MTETKPVVQSKETYGIAAKHEDNPAWAICPFCNKMLQGRNADFWNHGKKCDCGAYVGLKIATRETTMTNNLKCPFCSAELVQAKSTVNKIWHCSNIDCKAHDYFGVDDFWNTLIDGKKAQDALNYAINRLDLFANNAYGLKRPTIKTVERVANEALEKIASITKQENE